MAKRLYCLCVAALAAVCLGAAAQTNGPRISFESELPHLRQLPPRQAWQQLRNPLPHWQADAEYHYWRGVFALDAGELADARDSFERALMIDPDHAGALYDYGFTLCRLGERESCLTLLAAARRQHGLPPALSRARRNLLLTELRLGAGRSTNLNRGPVNEVLSVQLDGTQLDLLLGREMRPKAGNFLDAAADFRLLSLESGIRFGASAYHRDAQRGEGLDLLAGEVRVPVGQRYQWGTHAYELRERQGRGLQAVGGLWEWQPGTAWKRVTTILERKRLIESGASFASLRLDSEYQPWPDWSFGGFIEAESRSATRAGEATRRVGAVVQYDIATTRAGKLESTGRLSYGRDDAPFSPLFGETRRLIRQMELSMRLTTPLGDGSMGLLPGAKLRTELRTFAQRSNISLFDINEWQLQLSLVWNFQK